MPVQQDYGWGKDDGFGTVFPLGFARLAVDGIDVGEYGGDVNHFSSSVGNQLRLHG